ncbi:hypothetical protein HAX54_028661, partial [Datura stramonium]|nr:hypothetical protein [Datura stramonium]
YVPLLVEDPREKVRRFVDGLEHRYHGSVIQDMRSGTYSDVVDTDLHCESCFKMERAERERKRAHSTDGFNGAPSGDKNGHLSCPEFTSWTGHNTRSHK